MIQNLFLRNFQSHKSTNLHFDPGVNVIVGASDSGKTSILRALRWLIWNRPSGDSFRSSWGEETSVEATMLGGSRDGWKLTRKKDTNLNEYHKHHVTSTGSHRVYKAFGADVPEEIREILNIGEINLQQQLDSPFLLTSSPGDVAAHFNRIAKLDKIDIGTSNVNKEIRAIQSDIKHQEAELEGHKTDLENYSHLEKFEAKVEVLEFLQKEYVKTLFNEDKLTELKDTIDDLNQQIAVQQEMLGLEENVNSLLDLLEGQHTLTDLIDNIIDIETDLEESNNLLRNEQDVIDILDLIYKRDGLEDGPRATLLALMRDVDGTTQLVEDVEYLGEKLQTQFDKEFPERCPLCDKPK